MESQNDTHYTKNLQHAFNHWRKWKLYYGILKQDTRVQVFLDHVWYWATITDFCKQQHLYSLRLDVKPNHVFQGFPRNIIRPQTTLIRSGQIIDWNFIEPPQKQKIFEKWGNSFKVYDIHPI